MADKSKNQQVLIHAKGWAIKGESNKSISKVFKTQKLAIDAAKKIAKKQKAKVFIYNKEGKVRKKVSYEK